METETTPEVTGDDSPDLFDLMPDADAQKAALTFALQIARGFAVYFVVCDPAQVRPELMDEITGRVPDRRIQRLAVTTETRSLLHLLQETLTDPPPDAVFVYGLEHWISGAVHPRSIPFILNLNAARNHFAALFSGPLVFWVPAFVMNAIAEGAPDFYSVRSGDYFFPLRLEERANLGQHFNSLGETTTMGFTNEDFQTHFFQAQNLLAEFYRLPKSEQNNVDEIIALRTVARIYAVKNEYKEATRLFQQILKISQQITPQNPEILSQSLTDLGVMYTRQQLFQEAKEHLQESLFLCEQFLPNSFKYVGSCYRYLADVFMQEGSFKIAEQYILKSLDIFVNKSPDKISQAYALGNLAKNHYLLKNYKDSEHTLMQCIDVMLSILRSDHPMVIRAYHFLGSVYIAQGRYSEARTVLNTVLRTTRNKFGDNHSETIEITKSLSEIITLQDRVTLNPALTTKDIMPWQRPEPNKLTPLMLPNKRKQGKNK